MKYFFPIGSNNKIIFAMNPLAPIDNNTITNTITSFITNTIVVVIIGVIVQIILSSNKKTSSHTPVASPIKPVASPIKPASPCGFTCPGCNNSYPDRVKYGKEIDGDWFCNSTCNTIYNTRQRYANINPGPSMFPYNSNLATVHPLRVVANNGVVKLIF